MIAGQAPPNGCVELTARCGLGVGADRQCVTPARTLLVGRQRAMLLEAAGKGSDLGATRTDRMDRLESENYPADLTVARWSRAILIVAVGMLG